jgi:hypothetical protein
VDIYRVFGLPQVIANLALGFGVIGAAALVGRWSPGTRGSAFVRWIDDDMHRRKKTWRDGRRTGRKCARSSKAKSPRSATC